MKTIEKSNKTEFRVSKSLEEVWEWKEAVYEETKNMNAEEIQKYFNNGLVSAAKSINAKLVKCEDGSFLMI
jgi:hypothetical protein